MNDTVPTKKSLLEKYTDIMPRGAGALFFIQMFSTLSFSVLYSTLVLYTTTWVHMSDTVATSITASFVAFNFTLHLLGGYAGGHFLSYRSLFSVGMVCTLIGCILISIPSVNSLYWGLAIFLTGAGLNVTCINCMLTQLFQPNDKRREAAFLWNYSGMNVGYFVGFSMSGYFQLQHGYHQLFLLSSLGSLITLIIAVAKWKLLTDINTTYIHLNKAKQRAANFKGIALILTLILALRWLLERSHFSNTLIMGVGITMMAILIFLAIQQRQPEARNKIWAFSIFTFMNPFTPSERDLPPVDVSCTGSPIAFCKAFIGAHEVPMEWAYPPYIYKNFPIKNLVNDVNATFTATVHTTRTNTDMCTITFKGDRSVDVKSNDRSFRCTASIDGEVANIKVAQ